MKNEDLLRERYESISWALDERTRRLFAAAEAKSIGYGGVSIVSRATGMSRRTIRLGLKELQDRQCTLQQNKKPRIRQVGGGRKKLAQTDLTLKADLEYLVEPTTRGDPESPLRWTCKSLRTLSEELEKSGHKAGRTVVSHLLHDMGYSLQGNRKTLEGTSHPDRNTQFEYINKKAAEAMAAGDPVISVDAKKKELVGLYKNNGRTWEPKGQPKEVNMHDFPDKAQGHVKPYGVYDLARNQGWVSVGIDHDTSAFAVATIRRWWKMMGQPLYPKAKSLTIMADGGGSNSHRNRLWKVELQHFADEIGLPVYVHHFPPGASKWNKIEHRLFSFISINWRGEPLISHEVVVSLIASTHTDAGLKVFAEIDLSNYKTGIKITDNEYAKLCLVPDKFHGNWNYTIKPNACQDG